MRHDGVRRLAREVEELLAAARALLPHHLSFDHAALGIWVVVLGPAISLAAYASTTPKKLIAASAMVALSFVVSWRSIRRPFRVEVPGLAIMWLAWWGALSIPLLGRIFSALSGREAFAAIAGGSAEARGIEIGIVAGGFLGLLGASAALRRPRNSRTLIGEALVLMAGVNAFALVSGLAIGVVLDTSEPDGVSNLVLPMAFSAAALLWIARALWGVLPAKELESAEQAERGARLDAGGYVSSARTLCNVLFGALVLGASVAWEHQLRCGELWEARSALAEGLIPALLPELGDRQMRAGGADACRNEPVFHYGELGNVAIGLVAPGSEAIGGGASPATYCLRVTDQTEWQAWVSTEDFAPFDSGDGRSQEILQRIAADLDLGEKPERPVALYRRIESRLIEHPVTVPVIEVSLQVDEAMWAIAILVFVLLVLIRSRVRRVFHDPELAIGEPWLVLDGRAGIERRFARWWLAAVLLAPWIMNSLLVMTRAARVHANGRETFAFAADVISTLTVAFFLMGIWMSASLVSKLLELRRLRLPS